jgi:hypothetical protein
VFEEKEMIVLKFVIALILASHGIGHSMWLLQVFKVATVNPQWNGDSWLLTGQTGPTATHIVAVVVWTLAMVGFAALAAATLGWLPEAWFTPLAVGSSIASLAGLFLFPMAFPVFSTLGALAANVAVLVAVVWFDWVPSDLGSV